MLSVGVPPITIITTIITIKNHIEPSPSLSLSPRHHGHIVSCHMQDIYSFPLFWEERGRILTVLIFLVLRIQYRHVSGRQH